MKHTILIMEDEENIKNILRDFLEDAGYHVLTAGDGLQGIELFQNHKPDLALIDVMMPKINGYAVLEIIRKNSQVPVIFLTALGSEQDQINGLRLKADDYIIKPFSYKVLLLRVETVLRRSRGTSISDDIITYGSLILNKTSCELFQQGVPVQLTQKEYELLKLLLENQNQLFSRQRLLDIIWGPDDIRTEKIIDNHVKNIRKKLFIDPITTVRGMGYKIASYN